MQLRLIGKANGVGLSRDLDLLGAALRASGCEVLQQGCDRRERRRRRSLLTQMSARIGRFGIGTTRPTYDVNIMLEHIWPQFLHQARVNVLVPNPEWFDRRDARLLPMIDRIWAKTDISQEIFTARGCRTIRIGFDSEDRLETAVARLPKFLHLAGRSELKGTRRLVELWQRHPEWPQLTVIQDASAVKQTTHVTAANIVYQRDYLDDAALRVLQNSHRFHLCLSEAEGWGHYIAEALSVGAITFTCDAAPMNELVSDQRGVLVAAQALGPHNLSQAVQFDQAALEAAVGRSLGLAMPQLLAIGAQARDWFVQNKRDFPARVQHAVAQLK